MEVFFFITGIVSLIAMYAIWLYLIENNKIKLPRHLDIYNRPKFKQENKNDRAQ